MIFVKYFQSYLVADQEDCAFFWECDDYNVCHRKSCGPKTQFDPSNSQCNYSYDKNGCKNKKFNLPPGLYPDPNDCQAFVECTGNVGCFQKFCGPSTEYDPVKKACNHPQNNNRCKKRQVPVPTAFYQDPHDCRAFLKCAKDIGCIRNVCPTGTIFNPVTKNCRFAVRGQRCVFQANQINQQNQQFQFNQPRQESQGSYANQQTNDNQRNFAYSQSGINRGVFVNR